MNRHIILWNRNCNLKNSRSANKIIYNNISICIAYVLLEISFCNLLRHGFVKNPFSYLLLSLDFFDVWINLIPPIMLTQWCISFITLQLNCSCSFNMFIERFITVNFKICLVKLYLLLKKY